MSAKETRVSEFEGHRAVVLGPDEAATSPLARWGHFGVPVLVVPHGGRRRRGGRAAPPRRSSLAGWSRRAGSRSTPATASPGPAMAQATRARSSIAAGCSTSSSRRSPTRWCPRSTRTRPGRNEVDRRGCVDRGVQRARADLPLPHLFRAAVCMSGTFDVEPFIGGFTDDLYFSSPIHFLPGLDGPASTSCGSVSSYFASGSGKWEDVGESWRGGRRARDQGRAEPGRRLGPGVRPRLADVVEDASDVRGAGDCDSPMTDRHDAAAVRADAPRRRTSPVSSRSVGGTDVEPAEECARRPPRRSPALLREAGVERRTMRSRLPTGARRSSVTRLDRRGRRPCCSTAHYDVQPAGDLAAWALLALGADRAGRPLVRPGRSRLQGQPRDAADRAARTSAALAGRHPRGLRGVGGDVDRRAWRRLVRRRARPVRRRRDARRRRRQHRARHPDGDHQPARARVGVLVTVRTMAGPVHSGMYGGAAPDALAALVSMLATLRDAEGRDDHHGLRRRRDLGGRRLPRRAVPR